MAPTRPTARGRGPLGAAARRHRALGLGLAVAAAWTAGPAPPAVAAPVVSIRARTDVQLRAVRRRDDGLVTVTGAVIDRATSQGVGGLEVGVVVAGRRHAAVTAQDGSFVVVVAPPEGADGRLLDVELAFDGDERFDPATLAERQVDPTRAPVDLTLELTTTETGVSITADARADGVAAELPVTLRFTPAGADAPHLEVPARSGRAVAVRRSDLFGPGPRRVRARFDGDPARGPASAELTFDLTSGTVIDLALAADEVAYEGAIRARGQVVDDDGLPVARATVALVAGDRRLGATTTGSDGRWRLDVSAELLGNGRHSLQAAVEASARWHRSSRSGVAFVTVGERRPAPVGITLAATAATALLALGFILGRRRPWRRAAPPPPPGPTEVEVTGGLEPARPSLVSTLRRASDHGFAGTVRDAVRGRPLPAAELLLTLDAEVRHAIADAAGRFAVEALPAGEWRVRVASPGHVTEHLTLTIPHRGELRGARVDLVPVRERIFTLYRRAALPALPSPELWGIWSPRQIVEHVRGGAPPVRLAELTAFVEEAYFSARVPDEALLPAAEAKVAAALAERAGAGL